MQFLHTNEHRYQVRVLEANEVGRIDQVNYLCDNLPGVYYKKEVNHTGLAILTVPEGHPLADLVANPVQDTLIEIAISYRESPDIDQDLGQKWVVDFSCLYRDHQVATDADGNRYYLLYCPGLNDILSRSIIAYKAGTNNKSQWSGAELATIANDIVRWNCTEEATTANGRIRTASQVRGLTDDGSVAGSPVVDYASAYKNVLETLQDLAPICGFDFQVIRNTGTPGILHAHQYAGQLGTDRLGDVIFSPWLDNVASANLNADRMREKTIAIVGGPGEGAARTVSVRTGANWSAYNDRELFVDARNNTVGELATIGNEKMSDLQAKTKLNIVQIAPSLGTVYRRDYTIGDIVSAQFGSIFGGVTQRQKIQSVEVRFDQGQECVINVELVNA
jgi:hypothetical protein